MSFPSEPLRISKKIVCPKCGQMGETVWEKHGLTSSFLDISPGFYERIANRVPYPIELVCNACGTAQPERRRNRLM
jgi:hypothetical protein